MSEAPDGEQIKGVYVHRNTQSETLRLTREALTEDAMAEMIRQSLIPIFSIQEVEGLERQFMVVNGFAAKYNT